MKKISFFICLVGITIFIIRFVMGGNEDEWICENGVWTKHGNPSISKPLTECIK